MYCAISDRLVFALAKYLPLRLAIFAGAVLFALQPATQAAAQCGKTLCPNVASANIAASNATFDLSDRFLASLLGHIADRPARDKYEEIARENLVANRFPALAYGPDSTDGKHDALASDALAAYAAVSPQSNPRYRSWLEGYGLRAHTGSQGTFAGDAHTDFGGTAGIGATLTPNLSLGASVDQGRSKIDVADGTQNSHIDLTQIGLTAALSSGPWGLGLAGVYGFGHIHSARVEAAGEAAASYGTHSWGAVAELTYYWSKSNWRIVPKAGADWAHTASDAYSESGGSVPIAASAQSTERSRIYGGVELGYSEVVKQTTYDMSVSGKIIDIVSQHVDALTATSLIPGITPRTVPGVIDARIGYAVGATASVRLASLVRLYATYNGNFRDGFDSQGGTLGLEVNW